MKYGVMYGTILVFFCLTSIAVAYGAGVTTNNLTITKNSPNSHAPPGNPVNVPDGGTITVVNHKRTAVTLTITVDDTVTHHERIIAGGTTTLTVGSPDVPDADYQVIDPADTITISKYATSSNGSGFDFTQWEMTNSTTTNSTVPEFGQIASPIVAISLIGAIIISSRFKSYF